MLPSQRVDTLHLRLGIDGLGFEPPTDGGRRADLFFSSCRSPAMAPGEVVPLTSRAERRASRPRSAHSFPGKRMRQRRLGTPAGTVPRRNDTRPDTIEDQGIRHSVPVAHRVVPDNPRLVRRHALDLAADEEEARKYMRLGGLRDAPTGALDRLERRLRNASAPALDRVHAGARRRPSETGPGRPGWRSRSAISARRRCQEASNSLSVF
jgi:hypothetical protein